jgi:hypothetical protein
MLATVAAGVLGAVTRGPDSFGYTATNSATYSFVNVASSGGTRILAGADDGTATLTLPFSFRFYGSFYTSLCVSTNGLISFGGCNGAFNNVDLSNQAPSGDLATIAPLWTDLTFNKAGADAIYYQTTGTAPNRSFLVQWNNAYAQTSSSGLTFEVVLSESGSTILFQYASVAVGLPAIDNGASATVAIRAAGGQTSGNALQWSYNAGVLANKTAILYTPPAPTSSAVDVSSQVKVVSSGLLYSAATKTYIATVTVTNTSAQAIARPIELVFSGLTAGVTLVSPAGTTGNGRYLLLPGSGALAPGQSATVTASFQNPASARIAYRIVTYSGGF